VPLLVAYFFNTAAPRVFDAYMKLKSATGLVGCFVNFDDL
jgi:hypothetical protein